MSLYDHVLANGMGAGVTRTSSEYKPWNTAVQLCLHPCKLNMDVPEAQQKVARFGTLKYDSGIRFIVSQLFLSNCRYTKISKNW